MARRLQVMDRMEVEVYRELEKSLGANAVLDKCVFRKMTREGFNDEHRQQLGSQPCDPASALAIGLAREDFPFSNISIKETTQS